MAEGGAPAPEVTTEPAPVEAPKQDFKFADQAAAEKAATEAQAKITQQAQELAAIKAKATPATDPNDLMAPSPTPAIPDNATVDDMIAAAGLNKAELAAQWTENGKFNPEVYAAFKDKLNMPAGIANAIAGNEIAQAKARTEQALQVAHEAAGGADQWEALKQFSTTLDASTQAALKAAINNPLTTDIGVQKLARLHQEALGAGNARPLASGAAPARSSGSPFATNHEMRAAMKASKQKYGAWNKDPELMKRIEATPSSIQTAY